MRLVSHGHKHRIHFAVVDSFKLLIHLDVAPGLVQIEVQVGIRFLFEHAEIEMLQLGEAVLE